MVLKPSPKPRTPRATSRSRMSERCADVPSTRNLLETPSVAQRLDGYLRLKGSLRFPAVNFRSATGSRSSRTLLPLPACGERGGGEGVRKFEKKLQRPNPLNLSFSPPGRRDAAYRPRYSSRSQETRTTPPAP